MSSFEPGCYVTHDKLPELGAGEVLSIDQGVMRIRFATGDRSFAEARVLPHLTVTAEAPAPQPKPKSRARAAKSKA